MRRLSLYRQEQLRVLWHKAAILLVAAVLLCAFVLCWQVDHQTNGDGYSLPSYAHISSLTLKQPEKQREPYLTRLLQLVQMRLSSRWEDEAAKAEYMALEEADVLPEDLLLLTEYQAAAKAVLTDLQSVAGYEEYIQKIQKQSKRIQILFRTTSNMGYQERNVIKTACDYEALLSVQPVFEQNAGIKLMEGLSVGAYLLTIGTLLLSLAIHLSDLAYLPLFRSTRHGRASLASVKISVLLCFSTIMAVGVSVVFLSYAGVRYGFGDLARPVQSVSSMCPWKISVGQYLVALIGWMVVTQWLVAMLCSLLCIGFRQAALVFGAFLAILLVGALLWHQVPEYSLAGAMKYLNPYAIVNGQPFLNEYHNVNLFTVPVGLMPCALVWIFATMALLMILCLLLAKRNGRATLHRAGLRGLCPARREKHHSCSLLAQEAWRFFIGQKVLLLCLAVISALVLRISFFPLKVSPYEQYRRALIGQALQQDDASAWIADEYKRETTQNVDADSLRERALDAVMWQCEALEALSDPKAVLLYDGGYRQLLNGTVNTEGTLMIAVAITFLSMLTAGHEADAVLQTLPRARAGRRYRSLLKLGTVLLFFVAVLWADVVRVQHSYSLPEPGAGVASLLLANRYGPGSIFGYLMTIQCLRLAAFFLFACLLFALDRRGSLLPLAVSLLLVVLPLACAWVAPAGAGAWPVTLLLQGRLL